jgi:hypothetical protein
LSASLRTVSAQQAPAPTADTNAAAPQIEFDNTEHDFGKITGGQVVKHEFIFTNTGNATLEISGVAPSCGCTTAGEWSKKVEPGQTGKIPLQFNSGNFSGVIAKSATVNSNAKDKPSVVLHLRGNIWKAVDVNPQFAVINANSETVVNASTTVRINNNEEQPLTITDLQVNNKAFQAELKTNVDGKQYELTIKPSTPVDPAMNQAQVSFKTSSTNAPTVTITAMIMMQPVFMVMPAQINLPQAPLSTPITQSVSIRNNGTNNVTMSDAAINIDGIKADVQTVEPGHFFTVSLNFPGGFELGTNQPAELTIKTSHPDHPVVKIPVAQPPCPTPPPAVAAPQAPAMPTLPPPAPKS